MNLSREKGELENKIAEIESQNSMADQREIQYEDQAVGLKA